MALHKTPASMLKESLYESLEAAKFCCEYRKLDSKWGDFKGDGCLGYPGGILLFSIVDSIGSYFRKDQSFKVKIDEKELSINASGWEHFKILNSKYFEQNLNQVFIKALYEKFRSQLTHNSVLGKNAYLIPDNSRFPKHLNEVFFQEEFNGQALYFISMKGFYELCTKAVKKFEKDIDSVVPESKQGKNFY